MEINLRVDQLKAALLWAGKGDIRYYLNGVMLEAVPERGLYLVSTNGHGMFIAHIEATGIAARTSIIIPRESIETVLKEFGKFPALSLTGSDVSGWMLQGIPFAPIDGKFPEWRRVVPTLDATTPIRKAALIPLAAEYLSAAVRTCEILSDAPKRSGVGRVRVTIQVGTVASSSQDPTKDGDEMNTAMLFPTPDTLVIIMARRDGGGVRPTPEWVSDFVPKPEKPKAKKKANARARRTGGVDGNREGG